MSRRSSRSSSSSSRGGSFLDPQLRWPPATERLSVNEELAALASFAPSYVFGESDDHPFEHGLTIPAERFRPGNRFFGRVRTINLLHPINELWKSPPLKQLRMLAPRRVLFCLRRKVRKEVMFALKIAGRRGVGVGKRWRRTENSNWRC